MAILGHSFHPRVQTLVQMNLKHIRYHRQEKPNLRKQTRDLRRQDLLFPPV